MAVTQQSTENISTANGVATVYPFDFKILEPTDLKVMVDGVTVSNYTVGGIGSESGGDITFDAPPAAGAEVVRQRLLPLARSVDYQYNGDIRSGVLNPDFDRLWMATQQLQDQLDRAALLPISTTPRNIELPFDKPAAYLRTNDDLSGFELISSSPPAERAHGFPVTNYAAARLLSAATFSGRYIVVEGHSSNNDGGQGVFIVDTGDTTTPDNGATVLVDASGRRLKRFDFSRLNVKWFGVKGDGVTNDTAAVQAAFNAAASLGVSEVYFPPGTYLLTNPNNDADYTCAVVVQGLRDCVVHGAKGTKFVVNASGAGSAEFGMFRLEQCERVEFFHFEMDGSGIVINGTGANRSRGFVLVNYDVNNKATNLTVTNKNIEFHHIYVHDIGGFVGVPPRTSSLLATPYTDGLSVHNCIGANLLGQDHFVGGAYIRNLYVGNNRCVNDIVTKTPIDNMFVDASQGCENGVIENNYVYGFKFGSKCETHLNAGPSATETRPSKNILFRNNKFEQIGDPSVYVVPGPFGGDTYGIKLNGINCKAIGNEIRPRTVGVTAGGLSIGIAAVGTHADDSHSIVEDNYIKGARYGINHNDATPTTRKSTYEIRKNRIDDAGLYGVVAQSNVTVKGNRIYRAGKSAVLIQAPNQTIVRNNIAIDCASINNDVVAFKVVFYQEGTGAQGFYEVTNNTIIDTRGASAAHYGYFFRAGGAPTTNKLIFSPGLTEGLLTAVAWDKYFSTIGNSLQGSGTLLPGPRTFLSTDKPDLLAPWNTMAWNVGDRAVPAAPAVGSPKAWICTVAGTPGTWVSEGNL